MAASREGVAAVRERYGDVIAREVDEWPPLGDAAVALLRSSDFPLRSQSEQAVAS